MRLKAPVSPELASWDGRGNHYSRRGVEATCKFRSGGGDGLEKRRASTVPVQGPERPEPVLGRHVKSAPVVFPRVLAIVRPPPVVIHRGGQQVNLPSELSDHRLEATRRDLQIGREGGPPQQFSGDLRQNLRCEAMAVPERLGVGSAQATVGFGDLLASHLQKVQVLTGGDRSSQEHLPRVEVGLACRA
jgi:hypothetical protein